MPDLTVPLLVDYLYWMRDRVLATAADLADDAFLDTPVVGHRDLRATLAHELDVEMSWRGKLRGQPHETWGPDAEIKADWFASIGALAEHWRRDEAETRAWLAGVTAAELEAPVTVNGLDGRSLAMYLTHVVEHGVGELVTAAAILLAMGRSTGELSVLNFLDEVAPFAAPGA